MIISSLAISYANYNIGFYITMSLWLADRQGKRCCGSDEPVGQYAQAYCTKQKLIDPITEEEIDPDEKAMRAIEEQIGVTENAKKAFREEILIRISALARRGQKFDYTSHERLREAIEKKLFADLKNVVKMLTSTKAPDPEQQKRVSEVVDRLVEQHGYCRQCASELLRYVGTLLSR